MLLGESPRGLIVFHWWTLKQTYRPGELTIDQYLAAQVAIRAWKKQEEARQKQREGGKVGAATAGRSRAKADRLEMNPSQAYSKPQQRAPQTSKQLARELNVSEHKVQQALNVQLPDVIDRRLEVGQVRGSWFILFGNFAVWNTLCDFTLTDSDRTCDLLLRVAGHPEVENLLQLDFASSSSIS